MMSRKFIFILLLLLCVTSIALFFCVNKINIKDVFALLGNEKEMNSQKDEFRVDVMMFGAHPLLQKVEQGVREGAKNLPIKFFLHDASFQVQEAVQQTRQLLPEKPNAILAFGTPSIKAAITIVEGKVPVFFGATSDPVAIGVTTSKDPSDWIKGDAFRTNGNVYGLVTGFDYDKMAHLIALVADEFLDKVKSCVIIGYPMNDAEPNSVLAFNQLKNRLDKSKYCLLNVSVTSPDDVPLAVRSLISQGARIIQVGPDNAVVGAIGSVSTIAHNANVIVLASDSASIKSGADMAYAVDFYQIGTVLGVKLTNFLKKDKTNDNDISVFSNSKLYVNENFFKNHLVFTEKKISDALGIDINSIEVLSGEVK